MKSEHDPAAPQPTQQAFQPATKEDIRNGILVGLTCLVIFGVGMAIWRFGISGVVGSGSPRTENDATIIALAAPLMLPVALYFFYAAWRDGRRSKDFQQNKQRTRGKITHLWRGNDASQRKAYFVGYQYGEGQSAYQKVQKRRYDSLSIGDEVHVDFLPDNPKLSYFVPIQKRSKRKQADNAAGAN